ncbi:OmpA family protein [Treponema sp.]
MLSRSATPAYKIVERTDLSRYENGKYLGHVYRETRGNLKPQSHLSETASFEYSGDFYVLEETLRDLSQSARSVDELVPAKFRVNPDGSIEMIEDRGQPSLRGFPAYPREAVRVGEKWTARFTRAVDPRNEGIITVMPLIAQFEYRGLEEYKGIAVHRVFAKYATRYKAYESAPKSFKEASGTHETDILLRVSDGLPLLLRDRMDETFTWADSSSLRFRGFTLTFTEGSLPLDRIAGITQVAKALGQSTPPSAATPEPTGLNAGNEGISSTPGDFELAPSGESPGIALTSMPVLPDLGNGNILVEPNDAGIKLSIRDLRFAADSADLLPSERGRLDRIALALKSAEGRNFLVEGHTAAVGKPQGELELSLQRAKRVLDELVARGIPADRFMYRGLGGTKPLVPNDNEAARAKNRRVDITILE